LLERVCQDAVNEGFDVIEACPEQNFADVFSAMSGPLSLYQTH